MKKYRKKTAIEVIKTYNDGAVLVQNEGDPSDQWVIDSETFKNTYEEVKEF